MAHEHAHRLIYAADFSFDKATDLKEAYVQASRMFGEVIDSLGPLGITIKGNTLFRFLGYSALKIAADADLRIFADYKLFDVQSTMKNDFSWLRLVPHLDILTIAEDVHRSVFKTAADTLLDTIIAPVNPLTDLSDEDFRYRGETSREYAVRAFFARVADLPATGVICSPVDLKLAPAGFTENREIITPAIRPAGAVVPGDTNAGNALTPRQAILAGATKLVIGSPLRLNNDLRGNALRVLDEIGETVTERNGG
ncbi:MAG: orotidine 5'-phosphate decarboxylase / HUMPS family protein [Patescibacteria group bacterium]